MSLLPSGDVEPFLQRPAPRPSSDVGRVPDTSSRRSVPLAVTLVYTGFLAVLIPVYLVRYGPTNFLYFCDLALLITGVALWLESSFLTSMCAIGLLGVQTLWVVDLICGLFGVFPIGMTAYMLDATLPLSVRLLSLFHAWLPLLLLWTLHRLGYDRRALVAWTALGTVLLLVSYFFLPAPPAPSDQPHLPVNVNLVYGPSDQLPQTVMHPLLYLSILIVGLPLIFYIPTHFLLRRYFSKNKK